MSALSTSYKFCFLGLSSIGRTVWFRWWERMYGYLPPWKLMSRFICILTSLFCYVQYCMRRIWYFLPITRYSLLIIPSIADCSSLILCTANIFIYTLAFTFEPTSSYIYILYLIFAIYTTFRGPQVLNRYRTYDPYQKVMVQFLIVLICLLVVFHAQFIFHFHSSITPGPWQLSIDSGNRVKLESWDNWG